MSSRFSAAAESAAHQQYVGRRRPRTSPPTTATTGQIEAMPLSAGTGVDAVHGRVPAAAIVAELTDGLNVS